MKLKENKDKQQIKKNLKKIETLNLKCKSKNYHEIKFYKFQN